MAPEQVTAESRVSCRIDATQLAIAVAGLVDMTQFFATRFKVKSETFNLSQSGTI